MAHSELQIHPKDLREVASRISPIETVGLKERHENKELDSEQ